MPEDKLSDLLKRTVDKLQDAMPDEEQRRQAKELVKGVARNVRHDMQVYTAEAERKRVEFVESEAVQKVIKDVEDLIKGSSERDDS